MRVGLLAGAIVGSLASGAAAKPARVTVTNVEQQRPGWLRVAVRFEGERRPLLRVAALCREPRDGQSVIGAHVTLATLPDQAFLDLPEDLTWLTDDRRRPCAVTGLAVEMVRGGAVIARAPLPVPLPPAYPPPALPAPPGPREEARRLAFATAKRATPEARSAEAGVVWSLNEHLALGLSFERTTLGRSVPLDPGNGVRTSLQVGF